MRTGRQPSLFDDAPEGFRLQAEFISPAEEADLAARISELDLAPFQFHGFEARRRVAYFGWRYDFGGGGLAPGPPIPDWLAPLRDRAAAYAGLPAAAFEHVLVNEYREGAPIGWHRDRPQFERVAGISLLSPCDLRFRRRRSAGFERHAVPLAPRSAYLLTGPARTEWEHSIARARALRYSITFRNLAAPRR